MAKSNSKQPIVKSRNPVIEFDMLQMYCGEPYVIDLEDTLGSITVYQPTIGDIIKIGQNKFFPTLNIFVTNTTASRLQLWEAGVDWNETSDFQLFLMTYRFIDPDVSKLIFGDLDWSKFEVFTKQEEEKTMLMLYSEEYQTIINEQVYFHFSQYLRKVFNINPEEKLTKNKTMKQWYIDKDKRHLEIEKEKKEKGAVEDNGSLQAVISACINHPGFKYNLQELKEVGVCQFYDSVNRLQVYESATACMKGLYSGMVDGKKINPSDYNFMKQI